MSTQETAARAGDVLDEICSVVVVDRAVIEELLAGICARGHVLLEDVPGTEAVAISLPVGKV